MVLRLFYYIMHELVLHIFFRYECGVSVVAIFENFTEITSSVIAQCFTNLINC